MTTRIAALVAALLAPVAGCGVGPGDGTGSESHFVGCEVDADCARLGDGYGCRGGECRRSAQAMQPETTSCPATYGRSGGPEWICILGWEGCEDGHSYELRCDGESCFCFRDGAQTDRSFRASMCAGDFESLATHCGFRIAEARDGPAAPTPAPVSGPAQADAGR